MRTFPDICGERSNKYFVFNNVFPNTVAFMRSLGKKCSTARQATDENTIWRRKYAIFMMIK